MGSTFANDDNLYSPYGRLGGILTCLYMFATAFYGAIFIYFPLLPFVIIWPWFYRRAVEVMGSTYQTVLVAVFEKILGTKVVVTGDPITRHEKTVVLLNHRTRLDWLYFFSVVFHFAILNRQKIALKSMLKWVPGLGWGMQVAAYVFLDRNWETDQDHIDRILSYFVELESKPNILFFPEGTDLSEKNKQKSKKYAKKNGLQEFEYVLHPRTKGFTHFVNTLRNVSGIHAVHDVTVAYPYNIPTGEKELLKGEAPQEVHFHIKRYSIEELPEEPDSLAAWCQTKWTEKEEILRKFYSNPNPSERKFHFATKPPIHSRSFLLWLSLISWLLFSCFSTYYMITNLTVRYYSIFVVLFFFFETYFAGDFTKIELKIYELLRKPKHLWGKRNIENRKILAKRNGFANHAT